MQAAFAAEFGEHVRKRHSHHPDIDLLATVAGNALAGATVGAVDVWGQHGCVDDLEDMVARAITFDSISCAAIVTATSSGVRAPIWMPIGWCSRARSASPTPSSRSRASRSARVFSLPIAPM